MENQEWFETYLYSLDDIVTSIHEMVSQGPIFDIQNHIIPVQVMGNYNRMLMVTSDKNNFGRQETRNALAALDKALHTGRRKLLRTGKPKNELQAYSPVLFLWLADEEAPDHTIASTIHMVLYKTLTLYLLSLFFTNIIKPLKRGEIPTDRVIIEQQTNLLTASESLEYSHIKLINSDKQLLKRHDGRTRTELELAVEKANYPQVLGGINSRKISEKEADLIGRALVDVLDSDVNQELNFTALAKLVMEYMVDRCGQINSDITSDNLRTEQWFKQYINTQYTLPDYLTKAGRRKLNSVENATKLVKDTLNI